MHAFCPWNKGYFLYNLNVLTVLTITYRAVRHSISFGNDSRGIKICKTTVVGLGRSAARRTRGHTRRERGVIDLDGIGWDCGAGQAFHSGEHAQVSRFKKKRHKQTFVFQKSLCAMRRFYKPDKPRKNKIRVRTSAHSIRRTVLFIRLPGQQVPFSVGRALPLVVQRAGYYVSVVVVLLLFVRMPRVLRDSACCCKYSRTVGSTIVQRGRVLGVPCSRTTAYCCSIVVY